MNKKNKINIIFCFLSVSLTLSISFFSAQFSYTKPISETENGYLAAQFENEPFTIKDFFVTTLYGTFIGSIVGTATLTFERYPTKNLRRIAQGASIGLYVSILFGLIAFYDQSTSEIKVKFEDKNFLKKYMNYTHHMNDQNLRRFQLKASNLKWNK